MLDNTGARQLCYVVKIDDIRPIEGKDRVECAVVGGWTIMTRKGVFQKGGLGIYFEIDSKTPETEPFAFLAQKHYRIKTQKYGNFYSQGLLMPAEDFGGVQRQDGDGKMYLHFDKDSYFKKNVDYAAGEYLTETLGVTYYEAEDNARKAKVNPDAKINAALARHPKIAKKWGRVIKKNKILRKLFLIVFGKKKDVRNWPQWVVKTDEERAQNCPYMLDDKSEWIATEKVDGTSTTFTMKRAPFGKFDYYICSRNVVFDKPDKKCFYDVNVYQEMSDKYHVDEVLKKILIDHPEYDWVTLQGETYGATVQKRDYGMKDRDFCGFNYITSTEGRWNSRKAADFFAGYGIPWVPIVDEHFIMPDTVEELLNIATDKSKIDGGMREGLVFRSLDGTKSFKAVSNEFLMRYHS